MKLNETLLNIFSNFIPNNIKSVIESNLPQINNDIKSKIKLEQKLHHRYLRHKRSNEDFAQVEHLCNEIDYLIFKSKKEYYHNINKKLNDPLTGSKTYRSIMKSLFSGKKVPVIPRLLFNCTFVTDFQEKTKIFNSYFIKQCTLVSNNIVLLNEFTYMTEKRN